MLLAGGAKFRAGKRRDEKHFRVETELRV